MKELIIKEELPNIFGKFKKMVFQAYIVMAAIGIIIAILYIIFEGSQTFLYRLLFGLGIGIFAPPLTLITLIISFLPFILPFYFIKKNKLKKYEFKFENDILVIKKNSKIILNIEKSDLIDCKIINLKVNNFDSGQFLEIKYNYKNGSKKIDINLVYYTKSEINSLNLFFSNVLNSKQKN